MRHQRSRLRLKQKPGHAKMIKRNLVTSLLLYESVRTTKKRAKVIQPVIDRLIHYAKSHSPHTAVRYTNRIVTDKNASRKIMEVYCKRYADRTSGLSRITPVGARKGDGASLVDLILVDAVLGSAQEGEQKRSAKNQPSSAKSGLRPAGEKAEAGAKKVKETKMKVEKKDEPKKKSSSKKTAS